MLKTFEATLSPMLVLFLCMLVGFVLRKAKCVPENAGTVLSKLEFYVFLPALSLKTFMKYCTVSSIAEKSSAVLISLAVLAAAIAIAIPLSKAFSPKDGYKRNVYKYALTFGNYGFMGNAIVPVILGEEALYSYMLFTLPMSLVVHSWGLMILIPENEKKVSVTKSLLTPPFISIVVGAAIGLSGLTPYIPSFVSTAIGNLSQCMGPVAMILTGFVVAGYGIPALLKDPRVYIATFLRLIALPALFVTALALCGVGRETVLLAMFAYGTPLGLNTVVFPAAYGCDTSTGASMAMISHTLCVLTIPLVYAEIPC